MTAVSASPTVFASWRCSSAENEPAGGVRAMTSAPGWAAVGGQRRRQHVADAVGGRLPPQALLEPGP